MGSFRGLTGLGGGRIWEQWTTEGPDHRNLMSLLNPPPEASMNCCESPHGFTPGHDELHFTVFSCPLPHLLFQNLIHI